MATIAEALTIAFEHHDAGRLAEAEALYRRILDVDPTQPGALYLLGALAHQVGNDEAAADLVTRAVAAKPDFPEALCMLGAVNAALGRREQAVSAYGSALALRPDLPEAHNNLACLLLDLGRPDEAVASCRAALALNPGDPEVLNNLGNGLKALGRLDEAAASYEEALARDPALADVRANLGGVLTDLGRADEAGAHCRDALAQQPDAPDTLNTLGNAYKALWRFDEAIACFQRAIAVRPEFVQALINLGHTLKEIERFDEAIAAYDRAIVLEPGCAEAHNGLGTVWSLRGQPDRAAQHYETALRIRPHYGEARVNRALTRFVAGDFKSAWTDYEYRWDTADAVARRPFPQPWWDGRSLDGGTLLVWGDHGLGDQIMAAGMLPQAMERAGRVIVECDPRLADLFARSFPAAVVVPRQDPPDPRALAADCQIALLSLGGHFRATAADFPRHSGFLVPDAAKVEHWRGWLDRLGPGLKVGLSWRSRMARWAHRHCFPPLDKVAGILESPGIVFVDLQYDDSAEDIETLHRLHGIDIHAPPGLDLTGDIDGVAALTACLDGVVGSMTAVATLAGALGRPGWMYAYYPVFGEIAIGNADRMPWCPSVRVETFGFGDDGTSALRRIAEGLRHLAATRTL